MEFLKEFIKQENLKIIKELLKLNNKECSESEENYKKELKRMLNDNSKFLYVNNDKDVNIKCL